MSSGSQNPGPCPSGILPKVWETWGLLNECSLCHGCRGILGLTPDLQRHRHEGGRFETELAELETAALDALGCPFCRAAYRAFNHFNGKMSEKVQVEFYVGSPDWRNVKVHWYVKIPPEAMPDPEQWGPDGTFCITIEQGMATRSWCRRRPRPCTHSFVPRCYSSYFVFQPLAVHFEQSCKRASARTAKLA